MSGDASPPTAAEARAMALRYLSRREHARSELLRKLRQRGVTTECADEVIDRLAEQDLQSDERFCDSYTRMRVAKGYGPVRIRAELRQRGISDSLTEASLAPYKEGWYESAANWAVRKHRGDFDERARSRLYRAGTRRGFSHDQIMRAIDQLRDSLKD